MVPGSCSVISGIPNCQRSDLPHKGDSQFEPEDGEKLSVAYPMKSNLLPAAESLETSVRNLFKCVDAGDRAAALAYGPSTTTRFPVMAFDYDLDNKPVSYEGADAVNKYISSLFDTMAERKMKVVSVISNLRSGSTSPELGFATFELTQTMTVAGQSETVKFRVTTLMSQDAKSGKWRIFIWQATLVPSAGK